MGVLVDEFTAKLVRDKEIKSDLRIRSNAFLYKTVDRRLLSDYEGTDWVQHKENKKTVVLKKPKTHFAMFEDKLWTILAKMGFTTLSKPDLKLPYVDDEAIPGKQIDVFAADSETIIVVECKSAETMKKQHFSKELNEYEKVISGGNKTLKKEFSKEHKIKYIFATNNILLGENDRKRLNELHMIHFNQDDVNYYEQLLNSVGPAAKYQLQARLFKDQDIPALNNKIPAVRGKMGGYSYYSFSIEPEKLLKISYILHRINTNNKDKSYQRLVVKGRLKEIETFINDGNFFPNSIILNINTKQEALHYDKVAGNHDSKISEPVILYLPKKYHAAFIIDGQHRLYGYANTKYKATNSIPVVAFENLPPEKQIDLFVQINSKQRPVSKNLLTTIGAELMWNSEKPDAAMLACMSRLLVELGTQEESPLYRQIMLGDKKRTAISCITLDTIIVYGFKKTMFFAKLNKSKLIEPGYLWVDPNDEETGTNYQPMLNKSYQFFKTYFEHIKEQTETIWNLGSDPGGFIAMNIGILCFIRIASEILTHIKSKEGVDFSVKSGKEIAQMTFSFLVPVIDYVNSFDFKKIDQFRKYGTNPTGVETGVREFQREIHNSFKPFDPEGLQKWISDNSGKFNDTTKSFTGKIEEAIKNKIYSVLQENHGETWWKDAIPPDIKKVAANKRIDEESDDHDSTFLEMKDYKQIIYRHWEATFKPFFAEPEVKGGREATMKWFDKLVSIQKKVARNSKISQEDHEFITKLNTWLPVKIGIDKFNTAV